MSGTALCGRTAHGRFAPGPRFVWHSVAGRRAGTISGSQPPLWTAPDRMLSTRRSNIGVSMSSARRSGKRKRRNGPKPPRRGLERTADGVPQIAQCHPDQYGHQLAAKVAKLEQMLNDVVGGDGLPAVEVFESQPTNFRMRANFAMWREGAEVLYVMFNSNETTEGRGPPVEVRSFPMGSALINKLMQPVRRAIESTPVLSDKINSVNFLTTTTNQALITMTYNRPINETWLEAAAKLQAQLTPLIGPQGGIDQRDGDGGDRVLRLVGRSRNRKLVVGGETLREELHVKGRGRCVYTQTEGAFTQPNAAMCEQMLAWAFDATQGSKEHDLCELYCRNGCFTIALAPNFRRVVATEMSKASVELARSNLAANQISNARVARLTAQEFAEAYAGGRSFTRLREAGIALEGGWRLPLGVVSAKQDDAESDAPVTSSGASIEPMLFDRLHTLFVDPPRAGMDATSRKLALAFQRILYISCNPETLVRDLAELRVTHRVLRIAAFDQFPFTPHLEAGELLERRSTDDTTEAALRRWID